jgi:hypothetical protein
MQLNISSGGSGRSESEWIGSELIRERVFSWNLEEEFTEVRIGAGFGRD